MLRRFISAHVVGTVHMGIDVRVADGDIHQLHTQFHEHTHQPDGFRHIRFRPLALRHAEPIGIGKTVINIHPACHDKILFCLTLRAAISVSEEPGSVFKGTAVSPRPSVGREEFAVQIAVAALDVDAVKPGFLGHARHLSITLFQLHQTVVRDDVLSGDGLVLLKQRIVIGDDRLRIAVGF